MGCAVVCVDREGVGVAVLDVGRPHRHLARARQVDHVLGTFDPASRELVSAATLRAADAIEMIVNGEFDNAMNKFNGNGETSKTQ